MAKDIRESGLDEDEPSIEEILSSIRDIISDDEEADAQAEAETPSEDDDVLELTNVVGNDAEEETMMNDEVAEDSNDPLAGINLAHPGDDFDIFDATIEDEVEEEDFAPAAVAPTPRPVEKPQVSETLLNDVTEQATISSLSKLAQNIAVSRAAPDSVTLDDIVRDLLRPMLKTWLDENLPDVIERLVAKELERLAEKAARK